MDGLFCGLFVGDLDHLRRLSGLLRQVVQTRNLPPHDLACLAMLMHGLDRLPWTTQGLSINLTVRSPRLDTGFYGVELNMELDEISLTTFEVFVSDYGSDSSSQEKFWSTANGGNVGGISLMHRWEALNEWVEAFEALALDSGCLIEIADMADDPFDWEDPPEGEWPTDPYQTFCDPEDDDDEQDWLDG